MPSIGPTLPPHLAKRSRDDDADRASSPDSSDKRRRIGGPAPPPAVGPAPPPAPLDQRPPHPADGDSDSDSSDDDFGPAPPPAGASSPGYDHHAPAARSAFDTEPQVDEQPKKARRDDWMTMPPTQDDLAARMDPTKMRARKFNTGKSSSGGRGGMGSAWTETPEQKLKRLQDEAMGISAPSSAPAASTHDSNKSKEEEQRARKMREKIDAARGKSLVEQHSAKGTGKEKEDDPSKRAFDYEKDMAVIGTANNKQRRDMVTKSKGFGDRFSRGNFL
ncbi:hypothetical protein BDU57DRAFT_559823 [Ampelomyces quisqualis]|uniref:DUF3752 domain-containing protein n=1 Tax=Ampelomyces quisqualis TaxID=50730 RepID=A0A6A5QAV1_AMPQU|nr:hypothetical protein BDU57DRAFT_559823 [Ampelomyces quisqualis]